MSGVAVEAVQVALNLANPPGWAWLSLRLSRRPARGTAFYLRWAVYAGGLAMLAAAYGSWAWAATSAVSMLIALAFWWLSRRKRDRAPRAYGAKARALLEAVVRKMPRWEPRLKPEGAPA